MASEVPSVKLNDGNTMPQVGFGLWKVDNHTCADTVYKAIKTGYRLFDGACGMCTPRYLFPYRYQDGRLEVATRLRRQQYRSTDSSSELDFEKL